MPETTRPSENAPVMVALDQPSSACIGSTKTVKA